MAVGESERTAPTSPPTEQQQQQQPLVAALGGRIAGGEVGAARKQTHLSSNTGQR